MTRYVAFLRAINVRGHPSLRMHEAKQAFENAGCLNVRSFLQSGNILFDAKPPVTPLFARIRRNLRRMLKADPVVIFRNVRDLSALLRLQPFAHLEGEKHLKLYLVLLQRKPRKLPALPMTEPKENLDAIGTQGAHVFVVSRPKPRGYYGMPNMFVERVFGVPATSRYWSTLVRLINLAVPDSGRSA